MKDVDVQARALFERSVQGLDDATAKRLRLARRASLAAADDYQSRGRAWSLGLASAAVLVLGLAWWLPRNAAAPRPDAPPLAVEPAAAPEESVLAEAGDDADLYAWLGEAPVASDAPEQRL